MSQLVGAVVKTLRIEPYHASSIAEAIQLGEYDDHDEDNHIIQLFYESEVSPADQLNNKLKELLDRDCEPGYENKTIRQFKSAQAGLAAGVNVDLMKFNQSIFYEDVVRYGRTFHKKPMQPKHLFGIGIYHREEQRHATIVEVGSVWGDYKDRYRALCLLGHPNQRYLSFTFDKNGGYGSECLFGFIDE